MDNFQNIVLKKAYDDYFGEKKEEISQVIDKSKVSGGIIKSERLCADGNIGTVNEFANVLKQMLNVIWGSDWGDLRPDTSNGLNPNEITLPSISYSTNLREVSDGESVKPRLSELTIEDVNGFPTGQAYKVYRQRFDCIVEFNIRTRTSSDCSELAEKFEDAIILHSGFLKKRGVSEIYFLKEVPPRYSNYFTENIPTKTLYMYVRLEKVKSVSVRTLEEINARLELIGKPSDQDSIAKTIRL